jgi:glycosyltransferase involved in cell wall biosynthesis
MRILFLAPNYPNAGHLASGVFNERSASALRELCDSVEVVSPRPYVPPLLSYLLPRWKAYSTIRPYEFRNGLPVHRPASPVVPRFWSAFWLDVGAFLWCRQKIRERNREIPFDAILSFDLLGAGGIAWRVGRDLGIPACGWATGNDVKVPRSSAKGRAVIRALKSLDAVFYQSQELLEKAADLLGITPGQMCADRHSVLPRGILDPPALPRAKTRERTRAELGVQDDQALVVSTGRIFREKGVFDLLKSLSLALAKSPAIVCRIIGSLPAFDETVAVQRQLDADPNLKGRVKLLPACNSDKIWEYLCAADIFAFTSHNEGMPNSLLEAMAMGVPAIAFAIPPVLELEGGTGALIGVAPFNSALFSEAILRLAVSPGERTHLGEAGRTRVMDRYMLRKNMAAALERLAASIDHTKGAPNRYYTKTPSAKTDSGSQRATI